MNAEQGPVTSAQKRVSDEATKLVDAWWDGAVLDESNYHELVERISGALTNGGKRKRELLLSQETDSD